MSVPVPALGAWRRRAACVGLGTGDVPAEVCGLCPVALDCLEHALIHDIPDGTWGGFNRVGRNQLLGAARGHIGEALLAGHRIHGERRARNLALARLLHPSRTGTAPA